MCGRELTFGESISAATNRLPQIFAWSLVAATVGFILRIIEGRSERFGQIVSAILGMAWTVTTYLVVPILVVEGTGPIEAMKKSTRLLKKTWGDQLFGNFSFGIIFFLLSIPAFAVAFAGFALGGATGGIVAIVLAVVYLVVLGLVQSTLQTIFQAVLYVYAEHDRTPAVFEGGMLSEAMGHR